MDSQGNIQVFKAPVKVSATQVHMASAKLLHLDSVFEMQKRISIVESGYTMLDNENPVYIDDVRYYPTCFKHILMLHNSQFATPN